MVNLSKIDAGTYKSLGFKSKTIAKNMIQEVLQTKVKQFKSVAALVQHLRPKISDLIKIGFDVNDKKVNAQLKSIKKLSKNIAKLDKKIDVDSKNVEKIFGKWEKEFNNKLRFVTGDIKIKEVYTVNENFGRLKTYEYPKTFPDSGTYTGNRESVIEQFKNEMTEKHNRLEPSPDREFIVLEISITSIVELEETQMNKEDNAMKNATPLTYNGINEYREYLQNTGTCVVDNFIGMYGKELKLSRDKFIDLCKEHYKNKNECWILEHGISPQCVNTICEKYDITHYCFDVNKNIIIKHVGKNRNHKALIYFSVNNHMYLILDEVTRKHLIEIQKEKENFNTSLLSDEVEEKTNIFDDYDIVENPKTFFTETKNTIYMFSRLGTTSINDVFQNLIVDHGVPTNIRCKKTKIEGFKYKKNNVIYRFVCDPNAVHNITYKEVKVLCQKNDIPFKNQTFMQVVKQLRTKYFNEISGRIKFSKEFKEMVLDKSKKKCAGCKCCLKKKKYDIDHIRPLANGGTNEIDNLQALCKACHRDKNLLKSKKRYKIIYY